MERCDVCHEERLGVNAANGMPTCGRADCLLARARADEAFRARLRRALVMNAGLLKRLADS